MLLLFPWCQATVGSKRSSGAVFLVSTVPDQERFLRLIKGGGGVGKRCGPKPRLRGPLSFFTGTGFTMLDRSPFFGLAFDPSREKFYGLRWLGFMPGGSSTLAHFPRARPNLRSLHLRTSSPTPPLCQLLRHYTNLSSRKLHLVMLLMRPSSSSLPSLCFCACG